MPDPVPERVVTSEPPASALTRLARMMFRLAIERSHARVALVGLAFTAVFMTIGVRLIVIAATPANNSDEHRVAAAATTAIRPDIIDRNGEILATDIRTVSTRPPAVSR